MITLDFETRSKADLRKVGAYEYARHWSTEVLCLAWADGDGPINLWHPHFADQTPLVATTKKGRAKPPDDLLATPDPTELWAAVLCGDLLEAHNAFFERCIWHFVMVRKHGWPEVAPEQWRCSAAKASAFALPRKLEDAARALGLPLQKDMAGHKVMQRLTKPRNPTKADPDSEWHQKRSDLERLFEYCRQDVAVERMLSRQLRELPPSELKLWQLDQEMNWRGVRCDSDMARAALRIAKESRLDAAAELKELTGGKVNSTTARPSFVTWLQRKGVDTQTTAADTIDEILTWNLPPEVHRALTVWRRSNKTSTRKYQTILHRLGADERVRGTLLYHGATTGRWSGMGIQPHNFPRGHGREWTHKACADILVGTYEGLRLLYGEDGVLDMLADALRGVIVPAPDYEFLVADYSAIEARGTFWIADHDAGLDVFRAYDRGEGPDIYCWQAEKMFGEPIGKKDPRRQNGKVVILGCGYQMGANKLQTYAEGYGVSLNYDEAKSLVDAYRDTNWPVRDFWRTIEWAAIEAVRREGRGEAVRHHRLAWKVIGRFLHCRLPSGRLLSYLDPTVALEPAPWAPDRLLPKLYFSGLHTYKHKWTRCDTYGGKLTENVVQALCRDIMAEAMLRLPSFYVPVLTVHDEILAEVPAGEGSVEEFQKIMSTPPEWADGFPIEAEGWRDTRFHK